MTYKRHFDYDPFTGIKTTFEYDSLTDKTNLIYEGDAEPNLEHSKALAKDDDYTRQGMKNDTLHYAHIPPSLLLKWTLEGVDTSNVQELFKQVNKPEYAYLKTTRLVHR